MASFTMFATGTALDSIWTTKEHAYHQLLQHKLPVGAGFATPAVILALTAAGWACRKRWGWLLGVLILAASSATPSASSPPGNQQTCGRPGGRRDAQLGPFGVEAVVPAIVRRQIPEPRPHAQRLGSQGRARSGAVPRRRAPGGRGLLRRPLRTGPGSGGHLPRLRHW
jgi:hypothetical protein